MTKIVLAAVLLGVASSAFAGKRSCDLTNTRLPKSHSVVKLGDSREDVCKRLAKVGLSCSSALDNGHSWTTLSFGTGKLSRICREMK